MEEWDDDVLGIEECLFCSKISKSVEASVKHMTADHSFFIPDIEYLVDLEGFITYLGMLNYNKHFSGISKEFGFNRTHPHKQVHVLYI